MKTERGYGGGEKIFKDAGGSNTEQALDIALQYIKVHRTRYLEVASVEAKKGPAQLYC